MGNTFLVDDEAPSTTKTTDPMTIGSSECSSCPGPTGSGPVSYLQLPVIPSSPQTPPLRVPIRGRQEGKNHRGEEGPFSSESFPFKLHRLLNTAHTEGWERIVSWLPDGKEFKVHNIELFVKCVMPRFFARQSKYKSFQRQLNLWGFDRATRGPMKGVCHHPKFQRARPNLCGAMKRQNRLTGSCEGAAASSDHTGNITEGHHGDWVNSDTLLVRTNSPRMMTMSSSSIEVSEASLMLSPHKNSIASDLAIAIQESNRHSSRAAVPPIVSVDNLFELLEDSRASSSAPSLTPRTGVESQEGNALTFQSSIISSIGSLTDPVCHHDLDSIFA